MLFLSHLIAALAYAGAALLFGVALGERGELGFVQYLFAGVIPLASIVLALLAKRGRLYVLATGLAMFIGLSIGQRQFERAWTDCIVRGERVRAALLVFEQNQGGFPARLEELPGEVPCRCGFRTTILHYLSNDRGFRLWISDDDELWVGTDRRPFTPSEKSSARRDT